MDNLLDGTKELIQTYGIKFAIGIAILVIGAILIKLVVKGLKKVLDKSNKLDPIVHRFILNIVRVLAWVGLILSVLQEIGINVTSFLAIFAAAGAAVALALKDSLGNFAGGILMLVTRPFTKGDYISCSGYEGSVEGIDLLYTTIITADNKTVVIPNGVLSNNSIVNFTKAGTRRIDMEVGISYEADFQKAKDALFKLADSNPMVLNDHDKTCAVTEYADSAVILTFRVWVNSADYWTVKFDLQNRMKDALQEAGIEIPFPQMDVHLDK